MSRYTSQQLGLRWNRKDTIPTHLAKGSIRSLGSVTIPISIQGLTATETVHIIQPFKYNLILGIHIGKSIPLVLKLQSHQVAIETQSQLPTEPTDNELRRGPLPQTHVTTKQEVNIERYNGRKEMEAILREFEDVFSDGTNIGRCNLEQFKIKTKDNEPVALRARRVSLNAQKEIDRQVAELLKNGMIRESTSPYAAPITLALKKDGSTRMCIDFSELNRKTIHNKEPTTTTNHSLDIFS